MSTSQENISDTGNGIIVGAEPAQPRRAADWNGTSRPDQQVSQPVQGGQQPAQERPAYRWTDEDLEAARKQEKDKLYNRIEDLGSQLKTFQEQQAAELAEKQRIADEASAALRAKEEEEMGLRDLLNQREAQMKAELDEIRSNQAKEREIFAKERQLQEAAIYRRDRIAQESEFLLPELRDFVYGDTPEEIDAVHRGDERAHSDDCRQFCGCGAIPGSVSAKGGSAHCSPCRPYGATPGASAVDPARHCGNGHGHVQEVSVTTPTGSQPLPATARLIG